VKSQIANMIGYHLQSSALVSPGDNLAHVDKARATYVVLVLQMPLGFNAQ
jgi:hypothetical protein